MDDHQKINALTVTKVPNQPDHIPDASGYLILSAYSATPRFKSYYPIHAVNGYHK